MSQQHAPHEEEARAFSEEDQYAQFLETEGRLSAEVMIDLQDRGPLYLYVMERLAAAQQAMNGLVHCDPNDTVAIAQFQGVIHEWTNACDFINSFLERGEQAAQQIKEQFSDDNPHPDA